MYRAYTLHLSSLIFTFLTCHLFLLSTINSVSPRNHQPSRVDNTERRCQLYLDLCQQWLSVNPNYLASQRAANQLWLVYTHAIRRSHSQWTPGNHQYSRHCRGELCRQRELYVPEFQQRNGVFVRKQSARYGRCNGGKSCRSRWGQRLSILAFKHLSHGSLLKTSRVEDELNSGENVPETLVLSSLKI